MLYQNKKNKHIYTKLANVINCTNAQDGQNMVLYIRDGMLFVREEKEFNEKFTKFEYE